MIFELLILILVWSILNSVLQYTTGSLWPLVVIAFVSAIFCYLTYPIAIEQSVPVLRKLPENPLWLQRITVIILAEILFRWITVHGQLRSALGYPAKNWMLRFRYVPLPGLPAALFLFQVMVFYADTGLAFKTLAMVYAAAAALILPALGIALRLLLPGKVQRLELAQVLLIITAATACMLSVNVQFDQQGDTADKVADYRPFAVLASLVILVGALGWLSTITRSKLKRIK